MRLTYAQRRALELVAEQWDVGVSTAARMLIDRALSQMVDRDGVTFLEFIEAEVANEQIAAKRLVSRFAVADPPQ